MSRSLPRRSAVSKSGASTAHKSTAPVSNPISRLLQLYIVVIFVRVILSWFPISPDSPMASVYRFVYAITEPVLGPIRRMMPGIGVGGMGLDLSPIVVLLLIQFIAIPVLVRMNL